MRTPAKLKQKIWILLFCFIGLGLILSGCVKLDQQLIDEAGAAKSSERLQRLISYGANVNYNDESGKTPLMQAAFWGKAETIKVLLAAGADPKHKDKYGYTALMEVARYADSSS